MHHYYCFLTNFSLARLGRHCRTRTDIQSLEGSVLIPLNEAPLFVNLVRDAGIEPASSRLKGKCIAASANPAVFGRYAAALQQPAKSDVLAGRGCRSRICLAALMHPNARKPRAPGTPLIWRRSAYKALLLPEAPPLMARDGFEPSTTAL